MATTKTIQPTGATITIPEFTDQPDIRPIATDLGNITDAANALNTQVSTKVSYQTPTADANTFLDGITIVSNPSGISNLPVTDQRCSVITYTLLSSPTRKVQYAIGIENKEYKRAYTGSWTEWVSLDDQIAPFATGRSLTSTELTSPTSILGYPNGVYAIGSVDSANFPFSYGTALKIGVAGTYGMIIAKRALTNELYVRHYNNTAWNDGNWYKYTGTSV